MTQLSADCLNDIFEYLEDDKVTLFSCLLVNRLWCEVSVRFLWRNSRNYNTNTFITLIACLPNESKEILHDYGIIIQTPTSKPPVFNYTAFCKILSIYIIIKSIRLLLEKQKSISEQDLNNCAYVVEREVFKLFMNKITSLKSLHLLDRSYINNNLTTHPRAKYFLENLSELCCYLNFRFNFYRLSQICQNLSSLTMIFNGNNNGSAELISAQKNLKYLCINSYCNITKILPSLTKLPNTLTHLILNVKVHHNCIIPLSFITRFTNLQELSLSF